MPFDGLEVATDGARVRRRGRDLVLRGGGGLLTDDVDGGFGIGTRVCLYVSSFLDRRISFLGRGV